MAEEPPPPPPLRPGRLLEQGLPMVSGGLAVAVVFSAYYSDAGSGGSIEGDLRLRTPSGDDSTARLDPPFTGFPSRGE